MSESHEVLGETILRKHVCCYSEAELEAEFKAIRAEAWESGEIAGYTNGRNSYLMENGFIEDVEPIDNPYREQL